MSFPNHVCYADNNGLNSMVGDYLTPGTGSYYGGFNASFTDNAPAWNAIMAAATPGDTINLPPGYCGFKSKPNAPPDFVRVVGSGPFSGLVRSYVEPVQEGLFIDTGCQWTTFENILIMMAPGFSGGVGIGHSAVSVATASYGTTLRNVNVLYFNASSRFYGACKITGELGSPNYGTRDHTIDDCQFRASYYGLQLTACNAAKVSNIIVPEATYGIWFIGLTNNPCTENYVDGVGETTILCYNTKASIFDMSTLISPPIMDANCSGVTVNAAYMNGTATPGGGSNNWLYVNGVKSAL